MLQDQRTISVIAGLEYMQAGQLLHGHKDTRRPECVRLLLSCDKEELRHRTTSPSTRGVSAHKSNYWTVARDWIGTVVVGTGSVLTTFATSIRRIPDLV